MKTLAWTALTLLAAVMTAFFSFENRPTAEILPPEKARFMVKKNFPYNEELRLLESVLDSAHAGSSGISENTGNIFKSVGEFFTDPRKPHRPLEGSSAVHEDLRRGMKSLREDLNPRPEGSFDSALTFSAHEYERGMEQKKFPADELGNTLLQRAYKRLISAFPAENGPPETRKLALYILGDIGLQLWTDGRDMAGALCLIELIRTAPEDELAEMAWVKLNMQIHFGYSGSSGDHTPSEWRTFLNELHEWIQHSHRH